MIKHCLGCHAIYIGPVQLQECVVCKKFPKKKAIKQETFEQKRMRELFPNMWK